MNKNEEMAAALMHEVKNPVGIIKMNVELIRSGGENGFKRNFDVIERELSKLDKIVTDYKTVICAADSAEKEKIFLYDIICDIIEEYDISLADKKIRFNVNCGEDICVFADYSKICILFFNIIKNAVEAIDKNGSIDIAVRESGGVVTAEIADDGCGMDDYIAQNVGRPFVSGKKDGTGLGMVICARITEELGGSISIRNREEKGCVVRVIL